MAIWGHDQQRRSYLLMLAVLYGLAPTHPTPSTTYPYTTTSSKAIQYYHQAADYTRKGAYEKATQLLEKALNKDEKFIEAYIDLAYIHQQHSNFEKAIQRLDQAYSHLKKKSDAHLHYELAYYYYSAGAYHKAQVVLNALPCTVAHSASFVVKINRLQENIRFALEKIQKPVPFHPICLPPPLNQFAAQYFPVLTIDQQTLLFTARTSHTPQKKENIYISHKDQAGNWTLPVPISDQINTAHNEGTCTISADGKTLVFTSCSREGNYGICDLYVTYKRGKSWTTPINLGPNINTTGWESQPSLAADGKTLYFVSERKGNYGKKDIWKSELQANGTWSKAVNLGPTINSKGQEISPFIHPNGQTLFFASNRTPSLGGFDLYYSNLIAGAWTTPCSLAYPINNHQDQISLFITADNQKAYYAAGKQKGTNYYNSYLYEFPFPQNLIQCPKSDFIKLTVLDANNKKSIAAQVDLYDITTATCQTRLQTEQADGAAVVVVNEGKEYSLYIHQVGYLFESIHVAYTHHDKPVSPQGTTVLLHPIQVGQAKILQHIAFAFDQYILDQRATTELNQLVAFLQANPSLMIALEGHTDQLGPAAYNHTLSVKRAAAIYQYLVQAGIKPHRLTYKGYGCTQPIALQDSPAHRQLNRRVVFKITGIK